jgi:hypothetical protein
MNGNGRRAAFVSAVVITCALGASCTTTGTAHPASDGSVPPPTGPVSLSGWKLTLPVAGPRGRAATIDPATPTPPWLTTDGTGGMTLWAPVQGSTTPNSSHARTELVSLASFRAGTVRHSLSASVAVTQVPRAKPGVIVGQIHGADGIGSVPFVMMRYDGGALSVVVKQDQTGPTASRFPLLTGIPLGALFGFTISDNGDGHLAFTATGNGHTATATAPIPAPFSGAAVRFQTGAYQQADSKGAAAPDDGARVIFHGLSVDS